MSPVRSARRRLIVSVLAACTVLGAAQGALAQVAGSPAPASPPASPSASPSPSALPDHQPEGTWLVTAFDAWNEGLVSPRPNTTLTAALLTGGLLEGQTGCGRYVGNWSLDGQRIGLRVTSKGPDPCGDRRTEEAVAYSLALDAVTSWRATETGLELLDELGAVRVILVTPSLPGLDGDWVVERLARPSGRLARLPADGTPTLSIAGDGAVSGTTGCRTLRTDVSSELQRVAFGEPDLAGLPCDGDAQRTERWLLRALDAAVRWRRDGDALELVNAAGDVLARMAPATPANPDGSPLPSLAPGGSIEPLPAGSAEPSA